MFVCFVLFYFVSFFFKECFSPSIQLATEMFLFLSPYRERIELTIIPRAHAQGVKQSVVGLSAQKSPDMEI